MYPVSLEASIDRPMKTDDRRLGVRVPLPFGVEAHTDSSHPAPACLILTYKTDVDEYELVAVLKRLIAAIQLGPVDRWSR